MALTKKQAEYARLVASGMDLHSAALQAGCKNHEAARKYVADMAKRKNVQAFIDDIRTAKAPLSPSDATAEHYEIKTSQATQQPCASVYETPLEYLKSVFNDRSGFYSPKEKISAAIALLPYTEQKMAQVGKKESELDNAKAKTESGRFSTLSHQTDMFPLN